MAFESAKDYQPGTEFQRILITGGIGTGKSIYAASCETPGFVFCFDGKILPYSGKDWDYVTYEFSPLGWRSFERDFAQVGKLVKEGKYNSVVFDSTTSWQDLAMSNALALDANRSEAGGPVWNIHYGIVRNLIEPKIRQALSWPCNLVVVAHLEFKLDKEGNVLSIDPLLVGQLSTKVPGYFEEVYCAFTRQKEGKTEWYIRTAPRGHYKARSELRGKEGFLPDELPNDYQAVMDAFKKAKELREKGKKNDKEKK